MKRFSVRFAFFLPALGIACVSPPVLHGEEYTLAAYLARVEQGNPDLALALKDLEAARTGVSQARAAFLPSVGLQGGYTRNFTEDMRATPVASLPGGGPLIYQDLRTNYDNELTLGIGVNQTLFDAGAIANYRRARQGQRIREQSLEGAKAEAVCAAKKLYAQAQLALMVVEIMESSERLSLEIYRSAERTYRAGAAAELDMLMAEVNWKTKSVSAAGARKNAALVLIAFRNLGGIPLDEPVALTEPFGELPGARTLPDAPALDTALAGRADYRALVLSRELADIERQAAMTVFLPSAAASFSYALGGMGNDSLAGDYDFASSKLNLTVTVPLFSGGYRLARMQEARIARERADIALLNKRNVVAGELAELRLRLTEAAERVESARLIEETARRAAALARSSYANGVVAQLAVTEAVNKLDEASLGLQNAIFEYRAAWYDWELAASTPSASMTAASMPAASAP